MWPHTDLARYISEYYGSCKMAEGCCCLRVGFKGFCPHWVPTIATNWDELREEMKKLYV